MKTLDVFSFHSIGKKITYRVYMCIPSVREKKAPYAGNGRANTSSFKKIVNIVTYDHGN